MSMIIRSVKFSKKDVESCVCTIKMLRNFAYNTQGVLDWVDDDNCDKIIKMFESLIEIPTPHGRLVDLDKMVDEYWDGSSMRIDKTDIKKIEEYDVLVEAEGRVE